jgi:type IV pilus assembly protein PilQ
MRNQSQIVAGIALAGLLAWPGSGSAAPPGPNVIRAVDVADRDGSVEVEIRASRAPSYTVFKLQDPTRLVVDVSGGDVSGVASPIRVERGGVASVSTAQYQDEKTSVGRIVIGLDPGARYEVAPQGDTVRVKVLSGMAGRETPPAQAPAAREAAPQVAQAVASPASVPVASPVPVPVAVPVAVPAAPARTSGDHVVARKVDESASAATATAITGVRVQGDAVVVQTNGPVGTFEVIELRDPPRLAIDIPGIQKAPTRAVPAGAGFSQVRFGRDADKVRVVLDASGDLGGVRVKRTAQGLSISAGADTEAATASTAPAVAPAVAAVPTSAEVTVAPPPAPKAKSVSIQDLKVTQSGTTARIEVSGRVEHAISRPDAHTIVLTLDGAQLPKRLERSVDTSGVSGPLLMVSSFNQPSGRVRVVATLRGEATDQVVETPKGLVWTVVAGEVERHEAEDAPPVATPIAAQAAGFGGAAPDYALLGAPGQKQYTGQRITLDFHDIDVRNLLRLLADVSKKNIVVADDVTGKITVALRNVPWDQALDIVLTSKGLGKQEVGNVIRIAKFDVIAKEEAAKLEAAKNRQILLPLKVRIIPVNFSTAADIARQVKDVLTDRGTISVDERTNVLIVKDTQEALARAEGLVRNLDTETPGVLIESRIVEAASNFAQALGVQWGGNFGFSPATGNGLPVSFPNTMTGAGASDQTPNQGVQTTPNYAVNLPAAIGQGSGGGIGLVFGSANGAFNLNLRLTALERKGVIKTVSAPKVATLDNKEATISQGQSIPFSQVSASGVNTTFVEALLELKVTPHVTADGSILMKIKATNNKPDPSLTGANGQPSITKRQAETTVLVKDGDTTVIGGIYTRATSSTTNSVPFLGDIPILGFFFKSKSETDDHTELLIFITPRVLNRQSMVGTPTPAAN